MSLEQVMSQSIQGRASRRVPQLSVHMEPIEEEKSELALDIAQAVVEKLDIDRKLDERMKELMLRGDRIFRDIQIRQEAAQEALCRTVGMCVEQQRAFQEEHQRLLAAVKDLATMVIPYTPLNGQALEHQARAAAIVEETEALRKQMEENAGATLSAFSAAAALSQSSAQLSPTSASAPAPGAAAAQTGPSCHFNITLRKADDVSLGLSVNADDKEDKALVVENVLAGGAVESWNRQCFGDATGERVVVAGDRIVCVNGIKGDVEKMLEACTTQRLVKLVIARGPASAQTRTNATIGGSGQPAAAAAAQAMDSTAPVSTLRRRAPEFVPSGADAQPLQATQLAAPPGLFFPRPDDYKKARSGNDVSPSAKMDAHSLVAGVVSQGYNEIVGMQDVGMVDEDSDKEN